MTDRSSNIPSPYSFGLKNEESGSYLPTLHRRVLTLQNKHQTNISEF